MKVKSIQNLRRTKDKVDFKEEKLLKKYLLKKMIHFKNFK